MSHSSGSTRSETVAIVGVVVIILVIIGMTVGGLRPTSPAEEESEPRAEVAAAAEPAPAPPVAPAPPEPPPSAPEPPPPADEPALDSPAADVPAPKFVQPGENTVYIGGTRTLPGGDDANEDLFALVAFARAWSTGSGLSVTVTPDGLLVVGHGDPSVRVTSQQLDEARRRPARMPAKDCAEATLNQIVGEPVLTAYFAIDATISPWPSQSPELAELRCYGLNPPEDPAIRVCIADTPDGPRVTAVEVGLTDRPDAEPISRVDQSLMAPEPSAATAASDLYNVVLVAQGDTLNARAEPNASSPVVHKFAATAQGVGGTGEVTEQGTEKWVQLKTPYGPGWVNRKFVARAKTPQAIEADPRYAYLAHAFLDSLRRKTAPPMGRRGLHIMHFAEPIKVDAESWTTEITKPRKFNSAACEACVDGDLRKVVGSGLTDTLHDADAEPAFGKIKSGGNNSWKLPATFSGFNVMSIYDPADVPCVEVDWMTSAFLFDEENGAPVLVGVAFDTWSP